MLSSPLTSLYFFLLLKVGYPLSGGSDQSVEDDADDLEPPQKYILHLEGSQSQGLKTSLHNPHGLGKPSPCFLSVKLLGPNNLKWGGIWEKKSTEPISWSNRHIGYLGGYVAGKTGLINWIIGDFGVYFGQGLLCSFPKSTYAPQHRLPYFGAPKACIKPYLGKKRKASFRGIGATYQLNRVACIGGWFSYRGLDATRYQQPGGTYYTKSVQKRGFHVTRKTGFLKLNTIQETVLGCFWNRVTDHMQCGLGGIFARYSLPILPIKYYYARPHHPHQAHFQSSLWVRKMIGSAWLWSSLASAWLVPAHALQIGTVWSLSKSIDYALVAYWYGTKYHAPFEDTLCKQAHAYNERAIRGTFSCKGPDLSFRGSLLVGYHPRPSFGTRVPTPFLQITYSQTKQIDPQKELTYRLSYKTQIAGIQENSHQLSIGTNYLQNTLSKHSKAHWVGQLILYKRGIMPLKWGIGTAYTLSKRNNWLTRLICYTADHTTRLRLPLHTTYAPLNMPFLQGIGLLYHQTYTQPLKENNGRLIFSFYIGIHKSRRKQPPTTGWKLRIGFSIHWKIQTTLATKKACIV